MKKITQQSPLIDPLYDVSSIKYRLVEAASKLLVQEGYHKMKSSDIAKECGVKMSTLTHYFSKKEKIIEALVSVALYRCQKCLFESIETNETNKNELAPLLKKLSKLIKEDKMAVNVFLINIDIQRVNFTASKFVSQYIDSWKLFFKSLFKSDSLSEKYLCYLQGAIILFHYQNEDDYLDRFVKDITAALAKANIVNTIL